MTNNCQVSQDIPITSKWTPTAIDCYKNGCQCSKCNLYKIYFSKSNIKCRMKAAVIELVKAYGTPKYKKKESI